MFARDHRTVKNDMQSPRFCFNIESEIVGIPFLIVKSSDFGNILHLPNVFHSSLKDCPPHMRSNQRRFFKIK